MAWTIEETTADDPALRWLVVAQEVEVMRRYGVTDPGPGLPGAAPCLLARLDGRPVGCVAVALSAGGPPEIKRMYVDPHARGHGIGRALLGGAEQLAARLGHRLLRLETGDRAAGGRDPLRERRLEADPLLRLLQGRPDNDVFREGLAEPAWLARTHRCSPLRTSWGCLP